MRKISASYLWAAFLWHNTWFSRIISDEPYLKMVYRGYMGRKLNISSPETFNEKIQWLKLYDRRPEYTKMVDKYEAKKYVAEIIGEKYIIPTILICDKFDDIDFDSLPEKFVIKCTHDSGGLVICKDKKSFDIQMARKKITRCQKNNFYWQGREWPYKNVAPRIIVEAYMEDSTTKDLRDYKFFTFNGVVKLLFIATERQTVGEDTKFDFFDENYNHLDIKNGHDNAAIIPPKPQNFEEMKRLAEMLGRNFPHVRVDFYEVDGDIYFGELTFAHWSGMVPFEPDEWDKIIGDWILLPEQS